MRVKTRCCTHVLKMRRRRVAAAAEVKSVRQEEDFVFKLRASERNVKRREHQTKNYMPSPKSSTIRLRDEYEKGKKETERMERTCCAMVKRKRS